MGNTFSGGDGGSGGGDGGKRDRDDKGKVADDVQSSKKQKVASGDQGQQERADARAKLASMGFPLNAHTEELLRKHNNKLGTVIEELVSMQKRKKDQEEDIMEEEEVSSDGMQASGDEDESLRRALALRAAQIECDAQVYIRSHTVCMYTCMYTVCVVSMHAYCVCMYACMHTVCVCVNIYSYHVRLFTPFILGCTAHEQQAAHVIGHRGGGRQQRSTARTSRRGSSRSIMVFPATVWRMEAIRSRKGKGRRGRVDEGSSVGAAWPLQL